MKTKITGPSRTVTVYDDGDGKWWITDNGNNKCVRPAPDSYDITYGLASIFAGASDIPTEVTEFLYEKLFKS